LTELEVTTDDAETNADALRLTAVDNTLGSQTNSGKCCWLKNLNLFFLVGA
jgi:hypothetical protein